MGQAECKNDAISVVSIITLFIVAADFFAKAIS